MTEIERTVDVRQQGDDSKQVDGNKETHDVSQHDKLVGRGGSKQGEEDKEDR